MRNSSGTVYHRTDGRWAAVVSLGKTADGKRLRKTVYARSKEAVIAKMERLLVTPRKHASVRSTAIAALAAGLFRYRAAVGVVYFLRSPSFNLVKIGFSTDFESRMACLQTANPEPLEILATMPGTISDEFNLHKRFSADRHHGEWFRLSAEVADFIAEISAAAA